MAISRGSHCGYDTSNHLVWVPKYRKWVLQGAIRERVRELLCEIAAHHGYEREEVEVDKDHVHLFLSFPPRYGEFWEDGYVVRTVGDKVTADVIRK